MSALTPAPHYCGYCVEAEQVFRHYAQFWLGLQDDYDLEEEQHLIFNELSNIKALVQNIA